VKEVCWKTNIIVVSVIFSILFLQSDDAGVCQVSAASAESSKEKSNSPDLTQDQIYAALTEQAPLRQDFDKFVTILHFGDDKGNEAFVAMPVPYLASTIGSYRFELNDPAKNPVGYPPYTYREKPHIYEKLYGPHPLDAYSLPIDPANDRNMNGFLRWQPMMIDGKEKLVLYGIDGKPYIRPVAQIPIMFHLPDLRPVDREMYDDRVRFHHRRHGHYRDRYFPQIDLQDEPLTLVQVRIEKAFGVESASYRDSIKFHEQGGNIWRNLNEDIPVSEEGDLLKLLVDTSNLDSEITRYRSKRGDDIVLQMSCYPSPFKCLGGAYFVNDKMGMEFQIPYFAPINYRDWRKMLTAARNLVVKWRIDDDEKIRKVWLQSILHSNLLKNEAVRLGEFAQ